MYGGVAIFVAVIVALILLPFTSSIGTIIAASAALFALGLADDFLHLKPYQKLLGQLLVSSAVIWSGLVLPWTSSFPLNFLITAFWLVGITNAVNMLDNMDGLAAGVAAIAALFLAIHFIRNGQSAEASILFVFAAALAGFLVYNRHPASIFMGDCGSMFVGFFLASCALLNGSLGGRSRSVVAVLAVPVLVLIVPIFDTTLVTLMRKLAGRAASQGGRDHASHRLVALGLSEKHAVWMLDSFAIAGGLMAMLVRNAPIDLSLGAIALFTIALSFVGIHLAQVRVYSEHDVRPVQRNPLLTFLVRLSNKRLIPTILLDLVLIVLAAYFAHVRALPVVVAIKLTMFLATGMYRGRWQYESPSDALLYARGVGLGMVGVAAYTAIVFGVSAINVPVLMLDAIFLYVLIAGSRMAFRGMQTLFPLPHEETGQRAADVP